MTNSEKEPIFVESTLKVTAQEEIDIVKELAHTNESNLTIEELILQHEKEKKEE
jgi:hypothetical protein